MDTKDTVSNTLPLAYRRDRESHLCQPLPTPRVLCSPAKSVLSSQESTLLTSDGNTLSSPMAAVILYGPPNNI